MTAASFRLESASDADFEALLALRLLSMRESLERIGRYDEARSRARFEASFSAPQTRHIVVAGQRAGFVAVVRDADALRLDHLYLLPSAQGRGVGSAVLGLVIAEAETTGLPLRVTALRESEANAFYVRHGFVETGRGEHDVFYERPAGSLTGTQQAPAAAAPPPRTRLVR